MSHLNSPSRSWTPSDTYGTFPAWLPSGIAGALVDNPKDERADKALRESRELVEQGAQVRKLAVSALQLLGDTVRTLRETEIDLASLIDDSRKSE